MNDCLRENGKDTAAEKKTIKVDKITFGKKRVEARENPRETRTYTRYEKENGSKTGYTRRGRGRLGEELPTYTQLSPEGGEKGRGEEGNVEGQGY